MSCYPVWKNDPNRARHSAYLYHKKNGDLLSQTEYNNIRRNRKRSKPITLSSQTIVKKWKVRLTIAGITLLILAALLH